MDLLFRRRPLPLSFLEARQPGGDGRNVGWMALRVVFKPVNGFPSKLVRLFLELKLVSLQFQ